ncbi:PRD domain-containing protein [Lactobacillus isalae]|uniref:PRD domain-containing protein n=1 Tax=Lactobacillus isalae TaxID=2993455 RepID=UPI0024A86D7E|nr:PRD domain-containing protein [Lactobacillus isalae]
MKYKKKVNNNMALALDKDGKEWVLVGKGLGFGFKKGDAIGNERIEKRFRAEEKEIGSQQAISQVLSKINPQVLLVITNISSKIEKFLGFKLSNYNYLALADHVNFVIQKQKDPQYKKIEHVDFQLKNIYPKEYEAAIYTLRIIREKLHVTLPEIEANYLTLHYVNAATNDSYLDETLEMTELIEKITRVISYSMQVSIDKNSINYSRFITHIRYFFTREMSNKKTNEEKISTELIHVIVKNFPECYSTATKVAELLNRDKSWKIDEEEILYLTIHIWRLTRK